MEPARCRAVEKPDSSREPFERVTHRTEDPLVVGVRLKEAEALVQAKERARLTDRAGREPVEEPELLATVPWPEAERRGREPLDQLTRSVLGGSPAARQTWRTRCLNCSLDTLLFDVRGSSSTKTMSRGFL